MKNRKIPLRTCVITREKLPKKELLRVVRNNEDEVFVDDTHKANGRGAYLKKDVSVIQKAAKTKKLEQHLKTPVSEEIYQQLIERVSNEG